METKKPIEQQAFLPTKVFECTFCDILAIFTVVNIVVLLSIAGIIIGSISAQNSTWCSSDLKNFDTQTFAQNLNSNLKNLYIQGDVTTKILFDSALTNRIEVYINRSSLLSNFYQSVNTKLSLNETTSTLAIDTTVPTTDFSNCYHVSRIIKLPAFSPSTNIQVNVYTKNLIIEPTGYTPSTNFAGLTIIGGQNLIEIGDITTQSLIISAKLGTIKLDTIHSSAIIVSTTGDIEYQNLNSLATINFYTTKGFIKGENITMRGIIPGVPFGNITLSSSKGDQVHKNIKGGQYIDIATNENDVDITFSDYSGELQFDVNPNRIKVNSAGSAVIKQYDNVNQRRIVSDTFDLDQFVPQWAGYVTTNNVQRLIRAKYKYGGGQLKLNFK
ncbi:hypothetical protein ABK040_015666 [Willaertia magna]